MVIKFFLFIKVCKIYPVINTWVTIGLKRPSIKKSKLDKWLGFLSSAPKKRFVFAIPILTIKVSKITTVITGRRKITRHKDRFFLLNLVSLILEVLIFLLINKVVRTNI